MCLLGRCVATPPALIDELQAIRAEYDEVREFYIDLIVNGTFTGTPCLKATSTNHFFKNVDGCAQELAAAMSPVYSTDYFKGRMTITYRSPAAAYADPLIEVDQRGRDLLEKMGCDSNAKTLDRLKESIIDSPAGVWIEDLEEWIDGRKKQPALAPFQDSTGAIYMPIPSRVDKIDDEPAVVEILFAVIHEALRDRLELEEGDSLASDLYETIKLLRMGRRFRYDIVDPWRSALHEVKVRPHSKNLIDKFKSRCERYRNRLKQLQREGEEGKYRTYTATAKMVGCQAPYFEDIWRKYYQIDIETPIANLDADPAGSLAQIDAALEQFQQLNKAFMLIAAGGYARKLEKMEPEGANRADILSVAFGSRPLRSSVSDNAVIDLNGSGAPITSLRHGAPLHAVVGSPAEG